MILYTWRHPLERALTLSLFVSLFVSVSVFLLAVRGYILLVNTLSGFVIPPAFVSKWLVTICLALARCLGGICLNIKIIIQLYKKKKKKIKQIYVFSCSICIYLFDDSTSLQHKSWVTLQQTLDLGLWNCHTSWT